MPGRRVGVLGGTFDPPHLGHLVIASEAFDTCALDEVVLVPAGRPWQKAHRPVTPAVHRLRMAELAVVNDPRLGVSRVDVDRDGPTYTVDTVAALRADLGEDVRLSLVVGSDAFAGIASWHRAGELLDDEALELVVCDRPGHEPGVAPPEVPASRVTRITGPQVDVSSSDLRRRVADGRSVRYLVPDAVEQYLRDHDLYGAAA